MEDDGPQLCLCITAVHPAQIFCTVQRFRGSVAGLERRRLCGEDGDDLAWQGYKNGALMGDLESVTFFENIKKGVARNAKGWPLKHYRQHWQDVETLKSNLLDSIRMSRHVVN